MGKNKELGLQGEQLAADYLENKGFTILEMNYRHSRSEIDIIASKEDLLVFVEVKARTNTDYGLPENFVDDKKAEIIMKGADHYIDEINWTGNIRFDIISIVKNGEAELKHFEDAFY